MSTSTEDIVIEQAQEETYEIPEPLTHLRELLEGLDNEDLHRKWDIEMNDNAKEPVKLVYKKLPVYRRLKVKNLDNDEWEWGIIASMHNLEDDKVVFSCYAWSGNDGTFRIRVLDANQCESHVRVLNEEEYEEFDNSATKLSVHMS